MGGNVEVEVVLGRFSIKNESSIKVTVLIDLSLLGRLSNKIYSSI